MSRCQSATANPASRGRRLRDPVTESNLSLRAPAQRAAVLHGCGPGGLADSRQAQEHPLPEWLWPGETARRTGCGASLRRYCPAKDQVCFLTRRELCGRTIGPMATDIRQTMAELSKDPIRSTGGCVMRERASGSRRRAAM